PRRLRDRAGGGHGPAPAGGPGLSWRGRGASAERGRVPDLHALGAHGGPLAPAGGLHPSSPDGPASPAGRRRRAGPPLPEPRQPRSSRRFVAVPVSPFTL